MDTDKCGCTGGRAVLPSTSVFIRVHLWFIILALSAFLATRCNAAPLLRHDATMEQDIERDATGRIWATVRDNVRMKLCYWDGKAWSAVKFPDAGFADAILLAKRPNGAVVCLWRRSVGGGAGSGVGSGARRETGVDERAGTRSKIVSVPEPDYRVSEHRGATSRLLATFNAKLDYPFLFADKNSIWIMNGGKEIYRVAQNGTVKHVYTVAASQRRRWGQAEDYDSDINPLHALTDGRGRTWFFADVWQYGRSSFTLRGVLIWDGAKFTHRPTLPGLPKNSVINALARKDAGHLWLAVGEGGLYEVDIAILTARPVAEPAPKAFRYMQQITALGSDWYVIAGSRWGQDTNYDPSLRTGVLWRLRSGRWQRLIDGLDKSGHLLWTQPRPLLATAQGLWVGAFGGGLWFVPHTKSGDGVAVPIDWRCGLELNSVKQIFLLQNGDLYMRGYGEGSAILMNAAVNSRVLSARREPVRVRTFRTYCALVQDRHGHLWGALSLRGNALNEWNGERWLSHPVPPTYQLTNASEYSVDGRGRIWILADYRDGQVAIFDPSARASKNSSTKSWQVYVNYPAALQAQVRSAGKRAVLPLLPQFDRVPSRTGRDPLQTPDFSRDGRICFRNVLSKVFYFDRKTWRKWTRYDITKEPKSAGRYLEGPPFFNGAGKLCVNIENKTWQWTPPTGWKSAPHENDPRLAARPNDPTSADVPPGTPLGDPETAHADSIIRDQRGTVWIVWKKQLYKCAMGLSAAQFMPGENHPFIDKRFFNQVFVDNKGNTIFSTGYGFVEYVMLARPAAAPQTTVRAKANAIDSYTVDFAARSSGRPASGPTWFKWRLDNEPWSKPQTTPRVRLEALPGGRHRVEVAAIGRSLQADPTPAVATVLVNIDPAKQIAAFIADLAASEYSRREAAVLGLARQPARALPALKAARPQANADVRWWIDAAIQAAEESRRKSTRR